ncbi:MAG: murein biosynthesis integral membrane protein MurJ [Planctomycetota bacterium]|nr:MAG: murein biosynthesis integral membrane protein MurJ [Planctomycetota bacterium]
MGIEPDGMIKGFRQIASLTILSRILGMVRDMTFAHYLGAGWLMTAWTMGFKVPNLSRRLFGEGAASASFIPVYSEQLHADPDGAKRLADTVVTVLFVLLASFALIGEVFVWGWYYFSSPNLGTATGLALCGIMLPYMVLVCLVAIVAGILNVHRHFATPAASPIVLNIFVIASLVITGKALDIPARQQVFYVALGVVLAGLVQLAIQIPPLRASGIRLRPAWCVRSEAFKNVLLLMGPMLLGLTVTQINTFADDLIALAFSNDRGEPLGWGAVSHLYYAQRMYQFPLGVLGISLATAVFPVMSAEAARKDYPALCKTISRGFGAAVFVALPATAGILLVARPLISAVFQHGEFTSADTELTAWTLSFYVLGLCGYFSQQIATRAFYSTQDSKAPAMTALFAVFVNVILNLTLLWSLGTGGLALSTAICSYLQVVILVRILRKRYGRSILDGLPSVFVKTSIGTVVMAAAAGGALMIMRTMPPGPGYDIVRLAIVVPLSALVYAATAKLLRNEMFSLILPARKS